MEKKVFINTIKNEKYFAFCVLIKENDMGTGIGLYRYPLKSNAINYDHVAERVMSLITNENGTVQVCTIMCPSIQLKKRFKSLRLNIIHAASRDWAPSDYQRCKKALIMFLGNSLKDDIWIKMEGWENPEAKVKNCIGELMI